MRLNWCTANFAHNLEHVPHPLDAVQDAAELRDGDRAEGLKGGRGAPLVPTRRRDPVLRFVVDSPLEESGFELPVPPAGAGPT